MWSWVKWKLQRWILRSNRKVAGVGFSLYHIRSDLHISEPATGATTLLQSSHSACLSAALCYSVVKGSTEEQSWVLSTTDATFLQRQPNKPEPADAIGHKVQIRIPKLLLHLKLENFFHKPFECFRTQYFVTFVTLVAGLRSQQWSTKGNHQDLWGIQL